MEDGDDGLRGGDEEDSGGCCWRPVCADEGSSVGCGLEGGALGEQLRGRIVEKGKVGSVGSRGGNAEVKEMRGGAVQMRLLFWLGSEACPARRRNGGWAAAEREKEVLVRG